MKLVRAARLIRLRVMVTASALAIRDGRPLAVGGDHGMPRPAPRVTRVVDAMGRR